MIIDFHTHAFPEKLASKALAVLSDKSGNLVPFHNGTVTSLKEYMEKSGVDRAVVLNIATNPKQQKNVNDFAISINHGNITAFGSVHPEAPNALEELERIHAAGLKGIKLHPDYQDFFVDEERMFPIYQKAASLGLITVFHAGVDIGYPEPVHNTPQRLRKALPYFGDAIVVDAHMGGYMLWNDVEKYLLGTNVYLDTSYSYSRLPKDQAKRMIDKHGADRFLFGSDMPWSGMDLELRFLESLQLPEEDMERILSGNAQRILQLA